MTTKPWRLLLWLAVWLPGGAAVAADLNTALFLAAASGDVQNVKRYIAKGADVNHVDPHLKVPVLGMTVIKNRTKAAKVLLQNGADPNIKIALQDAHLRPLHMTVKSRNLPLAKELVRHGAKLSLVDSFGSTPLIMAASENLEDFTRYFLNAGADVDQKDSKKRTALHWAAFFGHTGIAKVLVDHGADVNAVTSDGRTALALARKRGDKSLEALLREAGAKN